MTFQSPITSTAGAAPLLPREVPPARCGRCGNNGTGLRNPACTSKVHDAERAAARLLAPTTRIYGFFTDEEAAAILESWSKE